MPPLRILSIVIAALFVLFLYLLFTQEYLLSVLSGAAVTILSFFWNRYLKEELVIYFSMIRGYSHEKILASFGKGMRSAITRLERKGIIEIADNRIRLKRKDYKLSVTKGRIPQPGGDSRG